MIQFQSTPRGGWDILRIVGYLLPMATVSAIISLIIALTLFRFFVSLGKTIWDLLPFA